jgi:hypothetical protein
MAAAKTTFTVTTVKTTHIQIGIRPGRADARSMTHVPNFFAIPP